MDNVSEVAKILYERYESEIKVYEEIKAFFCSDLDDILQGRIQILEELVNKIFKMEYDYFDTKRKGKL